MNKISNFINAKKRDLNPVFLTLEIDRKKMLLCYYIMQEYITKQLSNATMNTNIIPIPDILSTYIPNTQML